MIGPLIDHHLARWARRWHGPAVDDTLPTRRFVLSAGEVRVYDSDNGHPCVLLAPDGPNVIEHHAPLIARLAASRRVVCFDFPGFGHSLPAPDYGHSLDEGAGVLLGVLDALGIARAMLAFSCVNGYYALRAAQRAPERVAGLLLAQTPSMVAMHAWKRRTIPAALDIPGVGQAAMWLVRRRAADGWYDSALPRGGDCRPFRAIARHAFDHGACWCLASITQGLQREDVLALRGVELPCTLVWGAADRSHRQTDPSSLRDLLPQAEILTFADAGHFPDLEQVERFAELLLAHGDG